MSSDSNIYIKTIETDSELGAFEITGTGATSLITPNPTKTGYSPTQTSFVVGSDQLNDDSSTTDKDTRMLFDKSTGAFRAGTVQSTQWDSASRGTNSTALGLNNIASGANSFAAGSGNTASGSASITLGSDNNATTSGSVAIGYSHQTGAGTSSFMIGYNNATGSGNYSVAIGRNNESTGNDSVVIGQNNTATDGNAIAIGDHSNATNSSAVAIGDTCTSSGINAVAIGNNCTAGSYSFVGGGYNTVTDRSISINCADAVGSAASVNGAYSCAIGSNNTILGSFSHTYGSNNTVNCSNSIVLGRSATLADNNCFFWNGDNQTVSLVNSPIAHSISGEQYGTAVFWCAAAGSFQIRFGGAAHTNSTGSYNVDGRSFVGSSTGFSWSASSSRDLKENLVEHDYSDTLTRIMDMPIYTYNFKTVDPGIKSIGPVAQDFNRLFPSDKDQLSIVERDMCGVALAGVKGVKLGLDSLSENVDSRFASNSDTTSALQSRIAVLESSLVSASAQIAAMEGRLAALEAS